MRTFGLKALGFLIALSVSWVSAQPIPLIHMRQTPWRYYEAGNQPTNDAQPGVRWNNPAFDDSGWSQGLGLFGVEDNPAIQPQIQTYLWLTAPGATSQTITYYFRTQFQWNGDSNVFLWCTNFIDDGAVVYLNGSELYRIRISGTPTYATLAAGGPPSEGAHETTNVFTGRLLRGLNHLAVELHQNSQTSADVVFGLAMSATMPDPVVITRQPPAVVSAVAFDDVTLSLEATGSMLRYAWFRNNVFLSGQTNATLRLNNIQTNQAATFHVVVSNVLGAVRSSNSVVRVIPDTYGPRILSAVLLTTESNRLFVTFSEDILRQNVTNVAASGTNVNNYVVTDIASGNRIVVTQAVVAPGIATVRLSLAENLQRNRRYEICIYNISDTRTNYIALNSCIPVSFEVITNSVPYGSHWWFYDWTDPPPADWNQPEFVEHLQFWYLAPGMFYNDLMGPINPPCTRPGWVLSLGPNAYYFRKHFTVPRDVFDTEVSAILGRVIDDGVVFYLNGIEIMRTNMPAGPVTHDSRALVAGNPNVCSTNSFRIEHLLREENVLAAEVHQFAQSDFDVAFDASLALRYLDTPELTNRPPAGDVFLHYSNHSPSELRLFWTNGMGYVLEYVDALGDPWRELQPPSTNVVVNKGGPARFYRLNKRH